jgi:hypothetical protein
MPHKKAVALVAKPGLTAITWRKVQNLRGRAFLQKPSAGGGVASRIEKHFFLKWWLPTNCLRPCPPFAKECEKSFLLSDFPSTYGPELFPCMGKEPGGFGGQFHLTRKGQTHFAIYAILRQHHRQVSEMPSPAGMPTGEVPEFRLNCRKLTTC